MNERGAENLVQYVSHMAKQTSFSRREIMTSLDEGEEDRSMQTEKFDKMRETLEGLSIIPQKCEEHNNEKMYDGVREEYYCPMCER